MQMTLSNWGNSLGLRIPKAIAGMLGLKESSKVILQVEDGERIVVSPVSLQGLAQEIDLEAMVAKVTKKNSPTLSEDDDRPVGKEIW